MKDRSRWLISLGAALVALAFVAPFAYAGYRADYDRARDDTYFEAKRRIEQALIAFRVDGEMPPNVWFSNLNDGWFDPLGETWTEPQVSVLTAPVSGGGEFVRDYEFDGQWTSVAVSLDDGNALLSVVSREPELDEIASARNRWLAISMALSVLAGGVGWWLVGRSRRPVDRAHNVNRDFIADAAHELRTPLAVIQASAGHALSRERPAEDYRESLDEILAASERAGSSVGALLEFARLEAGQATPRLAPLRLDLLAEEVVSATRVDGCVVSVEIADAVVVDADYGLVRQAVDNIVRNAAARSSNVSVTTSLETTTALITVADDGPGFDPGMIDHVFERFRRGDRSGSAGLGMAIARTIVELHGGTCEAANRAEGGALVTVSLPFKPKISRG